MILRKEWSCIRYNYPRGLPHPSHRAYGGGVILWVPQWAAYQEVCLSSPSDAADQRQHGGQNTDVWDVTHDSRVRFNPWTRARLLSSVLLAAQSPELTTCPMSESITHSQLVWAILEAHSYINNYAKEIIIHWLAGSNALSRLPSWK